METTRNIPELKCDIITSEIGNKALAKAIKDAPKSRLGYKYLFNYSFSSPEARDKWIADWIQSQLDAKKSREDRKAKDKADKANFKNPVKVGDIFYCSWGYEQTNVDWYEVVESKAKSVIIREICSDESSDGMYAMTGKCVPVPGSYKGEPMKKLIQPSYSGSACYIRIASYAIASVWDGTPKRWSSYA